jgi:hypothetical protein
LVHFKSRAAAEVVRLLALRPCASGSRVAQGLAKGTNIPTVGTVGVAWHAAAAAAPPKPSAPAAGADEPMPEPTDELPAADDWGTGAELEDMI